MKGLWCLLLPAVFTLNGCKSSTPTSPGDHKGKVVSIHLPDDWKIIDLKQGDPEGRLKEVFGDNPDMKNETDFLLMMAMIMPPEVLAFGPKRDGNRPTQTFSLKSMRNPDTDLPKIQGQEADVMNMGAVLEANAALDFPKRVHVVYSVDHEGKRRWTIADVVPYKGRHYRFEFNCPDEDKAAVALIAEQVVKTAKFN